MSDRYLGRDMIRSSTRIIRSFKKNFQSSITNKGNHVYRTALIDRLMEKREVESVLQITDFETDKIIEALAHTQMINHQNVPFSTVF